jgi:glutathione S-transferase
MELILHNHQRSLYSEKVRRVLAYKGLDWTDIQIPSLPPKTNFVPLTGGYRRMPVLQIGADIYCDSALILKRLEEFAPEPSIFPTGSAGIASMITDWADHRVGMWGILSVFPDMLPHAPPEFIKDRTELVPDFAPDRVAVLAPHAQAQLQLFVQLVDQALSGQPFLLGRSFSAADAACYHILWFAKTSSRVFAPIEAFPRVLAWMDRIAAFELGAVDLKPDVYALDVARASDPVDTGGIELTKDKWSLGDFVTVGADDYAIERVKGVIVKLTPEEIAVQQVTEQLGKIAIHFPRIGFSIEYASGGAA